MYYLLSNKGFYAGEGEDRAKWMQAFKFAETFADYETAFKKGKTEKACGHIVYFEVMQIAER